MIGDSNLKEYYDCVDEMLKTEDIKVVALHCWLAYLLLFPLNVRNLGKVPSWINTMIDSNIHLILGMYTILYSLRI